MKRPVRQVDTSGQAERFPRPLPPTFRPATVPAHFEDPNLKLLEAIVGFEITIESLQAKYKPSQFDYNTLGFNHNNC